MIVEFDKIEVEQMKNISAISSNKNCQKRNCPKIVNQSFKGIPVKSSRLIKMGANLKKSEENSLNLNSSRNLKKPKIKKDKGSRAGSYNNSLRRKPSLLNLGCK